MVDFFFLSTCRHPTSCCSAAEIMSVLFFHTMRYKASDPRNACNDRFVMSKVDLEQLSFFLVNTHPTSLVLGRKYFL